MSTTLNVLTALLLVSGSVLIFWQLKKLEENDRVSDACLKRLQALPNNNPPFSPEFDENTSKAIRQ